MTNHLSKDAAVAVAAGLNVTEPSSTGIGGDMFCLFYDSKTKKVHAMNGSGRSGSQVTLERIRKDLGIPDGKSAKIPMDSVHAVTVPGTAAGWVDCVEKFGSGRVSMEEILAPAIELGEKGFPVSEFSATFVSKTNSKPGRIFNIQDYSGLLVRKFFGKHPQMVLRCSRKILMPKTDVVLLKQESL